LVLLSDSEWIGLAGFGMVWFGLVLVLVSVLCKEGNAHVRDLLVIQAVIVIYDILIYTPLVYIQFFVCLFVCLFNKAFRKVFRIPVICIIQ